MKVLQTLYSFHPVGQGLFSSGAIKLTNGSAEPFWWVFDCGTYLVKHHANLDQEIDILSRQIINSRKDRRPKIDLVFISHFDRDHINGLLRLLAKFEIGRLVLPFVPLHQRLLIALTSKSGNVHDWQLFLYSPVRFLSTIEGISIDRIAFVPFSGEEGPVDSDENESDLFDWPEDPVEIVPLPLPPSKAVGDDDFSSSIFPIDWLRPSSVLKVGNAWEFIPYNDATLTATVSRPFQKAIEKFTKALLGTKCVLTRKALKARIEALYGKRYGTSSIKRNIISLFVYAGPLIQASAHYAHYYTRWPHVFSFYPYPYPFPHLLIRRARSSHPSTAKALLLTGDGSLQKPNELETMMGYFGAHRIGKAKVLQVMHHGAKSSWHMNVASALAPEYSIFCAFPFGRHPHPNVDVWRSFLSYGPIRCADKRGFALYQELHV